MDPIEKMKAAAREGWSTFTPFEIFTATAAPELVRFAGIGKGDRVLDVGCGTGVVALTAARVGAAVTGADLTPQLLERARENAQVAGLEADFHEADVEALPFADAEFDYVLSQFGHIFGPQPDLTVQEMVRVLKPGGTIAFSTWPPELMVGRIFKLLGAYGPPPPPGVSPPWEWGDVSIVRERLASLVENLTFDRACMRFPALSPAHARIFYEQTSGPLAKLVKALSDDAAKLALLRLDMEALAADYFVDNVVHQDFLMTRGTRIQPA